MLSALWEGVRRENVTANSEGFRRDLASPLSRLNHRVVIPERGRSVAQLDDESHSTKVVFNPNGLCLN